MFIRKRIRKLKNGKLSTTYQAVESYRERGKVKQRVVSLGVHSNPQYALKEAQHYLQKTKENLKVPTSEYKIFIHSIKLGPRIVAMTLDERKKKRQMLLKMYAEQRKRVADLESLVSRYNYQKNRNVSDTTFSEKQTEEAEANFQKLKSITNMFKA